MQKIVVREGTPYEVQLAYEEEGPVDGEKLVFAHGLLFSSQMCKDVIRRLSHKYRCIAFDFRGHGESQLTDDGYGMDNLAKDTAALIEKLNLGPCHLVGFSMGGFVALRLALENEHLLKSLVLIGTSAEAAR